MAFHLLPTRRQTFTRSARKGLAKSLLWPHAVRSRFPHPDALAASGFYHVAGTTTRCFHCALEVDDWAEGDDVHERHGDQCPSAVFARLKDLWLSGPEDKKSWVWGRHGRDWPRAKWLMQLRADSFTVGWPRAAEKGVPSTSEVSHARARACCFPAPGASTADAHCAPLAVLDLIAQQIAEAGWFFRPGSEGGGDDCVMCPYCTRTVEGWEAGDVPQYAPLPPSTALC